MTTDIIVMRMIWWGVVGSIGMNTPMAPTMRERKPVISKAALFMLGIKRQTCLAFKKESYALLRAAM
jgi:hypothetical protein